jgi:NADH dehydrogenase/NADH:ubiquinone oxidoreductase subunit G
MTADSASHDLVLGLRNALKRSAPDLEEADRRLAQAPALLKELRLAATTVGLEGPLGALSRAGDVSQTTLNAVNALRALRNQLGSDQGDTAAVEEARTRVRESIEQMNRAGTAFVAFASEVLERDDQWDLTNTRGR